MVPMCLKCMQWHELRWPIAKEWVWLKTIVGAMALAVIGKGALTLYDMPLTDTAAPTSWQKGSWILFLGVSLSVIAYDLRYFWPKWIRDNWRGETVLIAVDSNDRLHVHWLANDLEADTIINNQVTLEMNLAHPELSYLHGPHSAQWKVRLLDNQRLAFVDHQQEYLVTLVPTHANLLCENQCAFNSAIRSLTRNLRLVRRHSLVAHCSSITSSVQ